MFSPEQVLLEHGLVGAFDAMAMIHDEELAIIIENDTDKTIASARKRSDSMDDESATENEPILQGLAFVELQMSSQELAAHLYHRFGVRRGDPVAVLCLGHSAAEFVACLACARIGAPFVPIDSSWIHMRNGERLAEIILDAGPVAAIVVAVHRCALICADGTAVLTEANICDIPNEIPPLYPEDEEEISLLDRTDLPPLYIMYTSGSTGVPKGVLGTHVGLINRLVWQYKRFPYEIKSRMFGGTSDTDSVLSKESSDDRDEDEEAMDRSGGSKNRDEGSKAGDGDDRWGGDSGGSALEDVTSPPRGTEHSVMEGVKEEEDLEDRSCVGNESDVDSAQGAGEGGEDLSCREDPAVPFRGELVCRRTPLTFVDSMAEMFGPLLCGVPVWAPPPLAIKQKGIAGISVCAAAAGVTRLTLLPSQLSSLLQSLPSLGEVWPSLKIVTVSGEACDRSLALRFKESCGAALVNIYGSTEVGADASYAVLCGGFKAEAGTGTGNETECEMVGNEKDEGCQAAEIELAVLVRERPLPPDPGPSWLQGNAPIGYAIDGNELFIARSTRGEVDWEEEEKINSVEGCFELVRDGEPGELFVGGRQLAAGYHNRPEETAKRFVSRSVIKGMDGVAGMTTNGQAGEGIDRAEADVTTYGGAGTGTEAGNGAASGVCRRLFRTGDIVVRIPKGTGGAEEGAIVWLGRRDLQVKVRGVRVELEEVERVISGVLQGILDTEKGARGGEGVVVVEEVIGGDVAGDSVGRDEEAMDGSAALSGRRSVKEGMAVVAVSEEDRRGHHLVLFLERGLANRVSMPTAISVRNHLLQKVEGTYVPLAVYLVGNIPRTTTGKLDRQALNAAATDDLSVLREVEREQAKVRAGAELGVGAVDPDPIYPRSHQGAEQGGMGAADKREGREGSGHLHASNGRAVSLKILIIKITEVYVSVLPVSPAKLDFMAACTALSHSGDEGSADSAYIGDVGVRGLRSHSSSPVYFDFYSLGGDSMTAVQAVWLLEGVIRGMKVGYSGDREGTKGVSEGHTERREGDRMGGTVEAVGDTITAARDASQAVGTSVREGAGEEQGPSLTVFSLHLSIQELAERIMDGLVYDSMGILKGGMPEVQEDEQGPVARPHKRKVAALLDADGDVITVSGKRRVSVTAGSEATSGSGGKIDPMREMDRAAGARATVGLTRDSCADVMLTKVCVHGRTDSWELHPSLGFSNSAPHEAFHQSRGMVLSPCVRSDEEGMYRAEEAAAKAACGQPTSFDLVWSSSMRKCVDASPLVIVRHYRTGISGPNSSPFVSPAGPGAGTGGEARGSPSAGGGAGVEAMEGGVAGGEEGAMTGTGEVEVGRVFLGSHGGDFSAFDMHSGAAVWTLDLESEFHATSGAREGKGSGRMGGRSRGRVHVEGSACCDLEGRVLYVGCFRGNDVDGNGSQEAQGTDERGGEGGEEDGGGEGGMCLSVGRVFAINASSGSIVWAAPVEGEIKGSPAVVHSLGVVLVCAYDGIMYVLAQATGAVLDRVVCGGSVYASPVLAVVSVSMRGRGIEELAVWGLPDQHLDSLSAGLFNPDSSSAIRGEGRDRGRVLSAAPPSPSSNILAFICTTKGSLLAISLHPSSSTSSTFSSSSRTGAPPSSGLLGGEEVETLGGALSSIVWEYCAGAPIFGTPCVTSTVTSTVPSSPSLSGARTYVSSCGLTPEAERREKVENGVEMEVWRRDILVVGVVDGSVRCLFLRSKVFPSSSSSPVLGQELWSVTYASKPIFSSVCCVDRYSAIRRYYRTVPTGHSPSGRGAAIGGGLNASMGGEGTANSFAPEEVEEAGRVGCHLFPPIPPFTVVFGSHDGHLRGISEGGGLLWERDLGSVVFSSPCWVRGAGWGRGLVVTATTAGAVYLVDCGSGADTKSSGWGSGSNQGQAGGSGRGEDPAQESCVPDTDAEHTPPLGSVIAHTRLNGEVYSSPVVCGWRVFLGCRDDKLHCLGIS